MVLVQICQTAKLSEQSVALFHPKRLHFIKTARQQTLSVEHVAPVSRDFCNLHWLWLSAKAASMFEWGTAALFCLDLWIKIKCLFFL